MHSVRFVLITAAALSAWAQDARLEHFEKKVRPVLAANCFACHSRASAQPQGGLALDSVAALQRGGNSGALFVAGDPDRRLLVRALRHTDKTLKMPPGKALTPEAVADVERWIREGAVLPAEAAVSQAAPARKPALWSLKAPLAAPPPVVKNTAWVRNDIDRFVLATLEAKGLAPAAEADKATLIRRVSFDLTGLPPTAEQVEQFVADRSPNAYESLVNRFLDSPQYGERYARHWLDVARYADSVNDSVNAGQRYPWSYTYRDWVIRAFNEDLPYDKFVLYQLAADRAAGTEPRHLAALGYLSLGREFPKSFPETVDDRIDAVARGFLGLTVACARCHDHKYDPITAKDYYSLYSVLANIRTPDDFPMLDAATSSPKQAMYEQRLVKIREDYQDYRKRRHAEMVAFFKSRTGEYEQAAKDSAKMSNAEVEELARDRQLNLHVLNRFRKGVAGPADVPLEEFELIYTEGDSNNSRTLRNRYNTMLAQWAYDGAAARAMAIEDVPKPEPVHVFVRGNPNNPGALAPPRTLSCLGGDDAQPFRDGSGRLELARSIIDPKNPVTARVIVNRMWMHHFGAGLVRTPSDFGLRGEAPTHPELLDYLAIKFVEGGWSIKKLNRLIMTSAAYRQAVADNPAARGVDPENLLLWRMNRRRLDIESLRDAMLASTGRLVRDAGGPPFSLLAQPFVPRRSVYGFIERGRVPAMLSAFDFASPDQHAPMRHVTTVPQQALFFLNSAFVAEQARVLAARTDGASTEERIQLLYRYAFGRKAAPWEVEAGTKFVSAQTKAATTAAASAWSYGTGRDAFTAFVVFDADRWQGGAALPAAKSGKAQLRATGGEPGETAEQAVVRRWTSPAAGPITIEGTLRHGQPATPFGDGVRGRIVSSRHGEVASWVANGTSAETRLAGLKVEAGDTIDFIVDARQDPENDGFTWAPVIRQGDRTWNAKDDFAGPAARPLGAWERYAQVLFQTNEFAFVD